jgi:hypothetical protein
MFEIQTLLAGLNPVLNYSLKRQLACLAEAMLSMSGRVTMLGLSRWTGSGGSYRTIPRFVNTHLNWPLIRWLFRRRHRQDENDTILIAGDEVNVTNSGKKTYGLGRCFSSLSGKTVPSLYFLNLSLISVKNRRSSPLIMEPVMPELIKSSKKIASTNEKSQKSKLGRPKGSQNQNRQPVELSKYLQLVPATIQSLLNLVNSEISLVYFTCAIFSPNYSVHQTHYVG